MFKNVAAVLEAAGSDTSRVLKTTLFIKNMADFAKVNKIVSQVTSLSLLYRVRLHWKQADSSLPRSIAKFLIAVLVY